MDFKLINKLLVIASLGLAVAGIIFIILQFFGNKDNMILWALICVTVSNLFNIIRINLDKGNK